MSGISATFRRGEKKALCARAYTSGQMSLLSASEHRAYLITHAISESQSFPEAIC